MNDDVEPRYAMIGSMGEDLGAVMMRLVLCSACGSVVRDTERHDQWHREARP